MAVFPLLYTAGFLSFLYFGIYIYAQKRKDKKSRLFLASCLGFSFWNLAYAAMTVTQEQYHQLFQKLGYLGAGWYEPFLMLFFIRVTGFGSVIDRIKWRKFLIYILVFTFPVILSMENLCFNRVAEDFPGGFWYLAHQISSNIYNAVSIFLLMLWHRKTISQREKRQALLIIIGGLFTIILTLITDFIMGIAGLPTLTPFLTLIMGGCIFYAFSRLNFMKTSPLFISAEILTHSPDIAILFDRDLRMLYSNRNYPVFKDKPGTNLQPPGIPELFEGSAALMEKIKALTSLNMKMFSIPVALKNAPGEKIFLQGCFSLIADDFDSFGGILFTGREIVSIDRFSRDWQLSPRETEVFGLMSSGRSNRDIADILSITERTVKNHVSSMMYKTKTGSRLEIVQLFQSDIKNRQG